MKIKSAGIYKGTTAMVEFEDGHTEFINNSVLAEFNIQSGAEIPESAWEQVKAEEEYRKARERALYLLDYKDYSYMDMYKKLSEKYAEETVCRVMDKLCETGCINDRRYAQNLARHYCEVKKFGRYRAYQEMRKKGLTEKTINRALDEYSETEYERLLEVARKCLYRYAEKDNGITKMKNYLVRQGYNYGLVKDAVNQVIEETENE